MLCTGITTLLLVVAQERAEEALVAAEKAAQDAVVVRDEAAAALTNAQVGNEEECDHLQPTQQQCCGTPCQQASAQHDGWHEDCGFNLI